MTEYIKVQDLLTAVESASHTKFDWSEEVDVEEFKKVLETIPKYKEEDLTGVNKMSYSTCPKCGSTYIQHNACGNTHTCADCGWSDELKDIRGTSIEPDHLCLSSDNQSVEGSSEPSPKTLQINTDKIVIANNELGIECKLESDALDKVDKIVINGHEFVKLNKQD